jgi:hypothetical protein
MTDEQRFSSEELLEVISRELRVHTELLRTIQMGVGGLAFIALVGVLAGIALAAS